MATRKTPKRQRSTRQTHQRNPDTRPAQPPAEATNHDHPAPVGAEDAAPGAGIVRRDADVSAHPGGPGTNAPRARNVAPGAQRVGTTEGRAANVARHARGGLEEIEAPSAEGQTAYSPATGGTGAPLPGSSGIRATSDPNFTARRADEEGTPSQQALEEQRRSLEEES